MGWAAAGTAEFDCATHAAANASSRHTGANRKDSRICLPELCLKWFRLFTLRRIHGRKRHVLNGLSFLLNERACREALIAAP
jgi:hypothetical protein